MAGQFGRTNAQIGETDYFITVAVSMENAQAGDLEGFTINASYSGGATISAVTDPDGECTFSAELGKTYTVTASKPGFVSATGEVAVEKLVNRIDLTTMYGTYVYTANITDGSTAVPVPKYKTDFSVVITPNIGHDLPNKDEIIVTVGGSTVDFSYSSGALTISGDKIIGDVVITATCPVQTFAYTATLTNGSVSSASGTATYGVDLSITCYADTYYNLPSDLTVKIGTGTATIGTDYTFSNGILTIFGTKILDVISITGQCTAKQFTVSGSITNGSITSGIATYGQDYTAVIVRTNEYYDYPDSVSITAGGSSITAFTYDPDSGNIVLTGSAITGDIVISGTCSPKAYSFSTSISNGSASPSSGVCTYGTELSVTITPASGYVRPNTVTVTAGGASISPSYSSSTGVITIDGTQVTGDIVITASCPVDTWIYSIRIDESVSSTSDMIVPGATVQELGKCTSSGGTFTITDGWKNANIVKDIKPYHFDGTAWTELNKTDESTWPTSTGDCFTEIPAFHYSIVKADGEITVMMSNKSFTGSTQGAFLASDGVTVKNETHIGCFYASGSTSGVYSRPGSTPKVSMALNQYWVGANARGSEYDCFPFQQLVVLQILYLMMFQDTNSQTAFARGYVDSHSAVKQNTIWNYTNDFGMAGTAGTDDGNGMSFFWVHDLWGNMYQFIASIFVRAGSTKALYQELGRMADSSKWDNSSWNNTSSSYRAKQSSKGTATGSTGWASSGYFTKACGTNGAGFIPDTSASSGSSSTYFPDYGYVVSISSLATFLRVGGYYSDAGSAGLFCASVGVPSTDSASYYGSRLSYRGGRT